MKLLGSSAIAADTVAEVVQAACFAGRAAFFFCDGESTVAIVADEGDTADAVRSMGDQMVQGMLA